MAGLANPTAPPPSGMTGTADVMSRGAGPEASDQDGEEPNVSEEEQAAYEEFVKAGVGLIYEGGEVRPGILELLDEDPADLKAVLGDMEALNKITPAVALAATTVVVVLELVRRSGESRPADEIIMHGGKALLEDIANLAGEAKVHDYTEDEINQAFLMGMDLYREAGAAEGFVDKEALKAEFGELVAADKEGRLGEMVPQLAEIDRQAREQEGAPAGGGAMQ